MKSLVQTTNNLNNITSNEDKQAYIRSYLEECSRSITEIDIIFKHFLNGGMLSEIIAPSEKAVQSNDEDLIGKSIQALRELDRMIMQEKKTNKDFRKALMANFMLKSND